MQHLGQLSIGSLISLANLNLSRLGELAGARVWAGEKPFTWQLGRTGKRQSFPVWGKFGIMYGIGEGNSVAMHKTLLLQCSCPG